MFLVQMFENLLLTSFWAFFGVFCYGWNMVERNDGFQGLRQGLWAHLRHPSSSSSWNGDVPSANVGKRHAFDPVSTCFGPFLVFFCYVWTMYERID